MKTFILTFTATLSILSLSSCNTWIGMGRDFQQLGSGIENTGHGKTWNGQETETPPPTY